MNATQLLKQVQYLLRSAVWLDSPGSLVFNPKSVILSTGFDGAAVGELNAPFVVVAPGGFTQDEENPRFGEQEVEAHLFVSHESDIFGEAALVGHARTATTGSSPNRGLHEIEERVLATLSALGPADGMELTFSGSSAAATVSVQGTTQIIRRAYTFAAFIDSARSYPPAYNVAGAVPGGGAVNLTWSDPPSRFDRKGVHIRRAAGATAPTLSTGSLVANVAAGVETYADAPGAGQFTYAIWGTYDETGAGNVERYSDSAVTKTVTAT